MPFSKRQLCKRKQNKAKTHTKFRLSYNFKILQENEGKRTKLNEYEKNILSLCVMYIYIYIYIYIRIYSQISIYLSIYLPVCIRAKPRIFCGSVDWFSKLQICDKENSEKH